MVTSKLTSDNKAVVRVLAWKYVRLILKEVGCSVPEAYTIAHTALTASQLSDDVRPLDEAPPDEFTSWLRDDDD